VKRRLAFVSFLTALYPPVVLIVEALLSPLVQQQEGCPALHAPSGLAMHLCGIQNLSPLVGVFTVANYAILVAILATLVSGHVALYHHKRAALTTSRRNLAILGLALGYVWGGIAAYIILALLGLFGGIE
jgi:hypothetical protein